MPVITGFYLAILLLFYVALGAQVALLRRGNRVLFGDGDNIKLRSAIRIHANFAEYVPITVLMVAILEVAGMPPGHVHWLMGLLLLSRLIHPIGMYVGPRSWQFQVGRVGGIILTLFVMVSAAIAGLRWFWPAQEP